MINSLTLENFRIFKKTTFEFKKNFTIIYGNNAKGKSTILESIFLILNGYSPWQNQYENIINYQDTKKNYFSITINLHNEDTLTFYQDNIRKQYLINKKKTTKKNFLNFHKANLFSPEQIELLMYLPNKRREFLDNLISDISIEYTENLKNYKQILRQRNAHLKKLSKKFFETQTLNENDAQIKYWDKMLTDIGSEIMLQRINIIQKLDSNNFKIQYKPSVDLNLFEEMLSKKEIQDIFSKQIQKNRKRDIVTGFSNIGVHRDDWTLLSPRLDLKRFGSRGEKRLAIANLILEKQEIYKNHLRYYPILLLDDISAELDKENSKKFFENKIIKKQQIFISTTSKGTIPKDILEQATLIELK